MHEAREEKVEKRGMGVIVLSSRTIRAGAKHHSVSWFLSVEQFHHKREDKGTERERNVFNVVSPRTPSLIPHLRTCCSHLHLVAQGLKGALHGLFGRVFGTPIHQACRGSVRGQLGREQFRPYVRFAAGIILPANTTHEHTVVGIVGVNLISRFSFRSRITPADPVTTQRVNAATEDPYIRRWCLVSWGLP